MKRNGLVVDNVDPDEKDRVKLRILPEMQDVADDDLPFVKPKYKGRKIPEIDDIVLVDLDEHFNIRNMKYYNSVYVLNTTNYDDITSDVDAITDKVSTYEYPQPNEYQKFKDGSYVFRNTETGELVFCHNTGVYTIYDEDGNITHYTKDKYFKVYNDKLSMQLSDNGDYLFENSSATISIKDAGDIELSNSTCNIKLGSASVTINDNVEVLV
jgi:hypothetical protein